MYAVHAMQYCLMMHSPFLDDCTSVTIIERCVQSIVPVDDIRDSLFSSELVKGELREGKRALEMLERRPVLGGLVLHRGISRPKSTKHTSSCRCAIASFPALCAPFEHKYIWDL